jgi:hypothetical protein
MIPLARTGLNFVDVRDCALGHLLSMARGKSGERYLLGGINMWLRDFLKRTGPYARYRTPCNARIRANVARSTFFQQCKGGKRDRLFSYLLDRPSYS